VVRAHFLEAFANGVNGALGLIAIAAEMAEIKVA
jgi:hypothetical protein